MLLVEIARFLDAQGIGTFDEKGIRGNMFINNVPASPDYTISLFSTGGLQGDVKNGYDSPTVQIWLRGDKNPLAAFKKAEEIYNALNGFSGKCFTPDGIYIVDCRGIQSAPIHMGTDNNGRHQYSINFMLNTKNNSRRR